MKISRTARVRHGELVDGDLVCWNCRERLIAGYVSLIAEAGPVPFFGDMTLVCNKCSCANGSPSTASASTIGDSAEGSKGDRSKIARKDSGNGP